MAKRRKEEALETRERILDAAITVFHERGVARPSLTDIAELAGVTRGAVYGHFRNKADLFTALTDRITLPGETLCSACTSEASRDPLGELRARWAFLFHEVARNRQWQLIFEIVLHRCELVTESGQIHQRMMQGHAEGAARIQELLQLAVDCGQLPADLDVKLATPIVHGSLFGVLEDWLLQPHAYDLGCVGERHIEALTDMLRNSPVLRGSEHRSAEASTNDLPLGTP